MIKPLLVNLPYPELNDITEDRKSALCISEAYSGSHGELNAILQYVYHYFYFKKQGEEDIAQTVMGIAVAEMRHLQVLGELMLKLGCDPIFALPPFGKENFCASNVRYSKSIEKMLLDDLSMEMVAINRYDAIINLLKNERVEGVILRIKLDEELHVKALKESFDEYKKRKKI